MNQTTGVLAIDADAQRLKRSLGINLGIVIAYFLAAKLGLEFAVVGSTVTLVWPPSGIALVALLTFGPRVAPSVFVGAFLANMWNELGGQYALLIALGNTLEGLASMYLLGRLADFRHDLTRRRDVFALMAIAGLACTMIAASAGALTLVLAGVTDWAGWLAVWVTWWLGDMMGVLVVAPALLVCINHPWRKPTAEMLAEWVALLVAVGFMSYVIFGTTELAGHGYYPSALSVFPFVIWGALRLGHWGAVSVIGVVSVVAVLGTAQGTGPFAVSSNVDSLIGWCAFTNVMAVTGLLLATFRAEQQKDRAALLQAQDELEQRVAERTEALAGAIQELSSQIARRLRLESDLISISERQQKAFGQELHDGLGQHLTSLAFFAATLHQTLQRQGVNESRLAERIVLMLNEAIRMTRDISRGLYPAELETLGLDGALRLLLERTALVSGVNCRYLNELPQLQLTQQVVINLYRFAQEAMNNAVKHSRAKNLVLELCEDEGCLVLSVTDDGIGIAEIQGEHALGIGLHSLHHRADLLGGSFEIGNGDAGGCRVALRHPKLPRVAE